MVATIAALLGATGCGGASEPTSPPNGQPDSGVSPAEPTDDLVDDRSVYEQDDLQVRTLRVTVWDLAGLDRVHADEPGAEVAALVQADGFAGDVTTPNASLRLRGKSSRAAEQKSYRIRLASNTDLWRGHRVINLNKHPYDLTRVRNKLAFDLFRRVPHMTSLHSGFVRLVLNGEDMGLFTQIERPDRLFLIAHGLDPAGALYKAEEFMFDDIDSATFDDPDQLSQIVEVKAHPDHETLAAMLTAVNDEGRDIDDVIATHFYRDNYLAWLAANVLMGNLDTVDQNFYLYSPSDSDRWYFLPWDYDDAWGIFDQPAQGLPRGRFEEGLANWWFPVLHNRFLRRPDNLIALSQTIDELHETVINNSEVVSLLAEYREVVRAHVAREPDLYELPVPSGTTGSEAILAAFDTEYSRIGQTSGVFLAEYRATLNRPMPVWIEGPYDIGGDQMEFHWSESVRLTDNSDSITYHLQVHTDPEFPAAGLLVDRPDLTESRASFSALPAGQYVARVTIHSSAAGTWQLCANFHYDDDTDDWEKGLLRFTVAP
ncbi:MAG: CotH kinase family protein [Proteobacteria bacterium]|nr:CotH kinase family protein [Pseudomonadota bacterium]